MSEFEERGDSGGPVEIPAGARPKALWPSPRTLVAGVVGFPVRHSLSPRLQNAAYAAMGLDWCYLAFEVPPGSLERAVVGCRGARASRPVGDDAPQGRGRTIGNPALAPGPAPRSREHADLRAGRRPRGELRRGRVARRPAGGRGLRPRRPALRGHRCRRRRQGGRARPGGGRRGRDRRRQQDGHTSLEVGLAGAACGSCRPPGGAEGDGPRRAGHTDGHARCRSLEPVFSPPHGWLQRL